MFFAPVMEPVTETVAVKIAHVGKGEMVQAGNTKFFKVAEVKRGTKYVTLLDEDGNHIARKEGSETVLVERESQWSRNVRAEAKHVNQVNERLRQAAAEYKPNEKTKAALARLTEQAYSGYVADSFRTQDLIKAQAYDEVYGRFYAAVKNALEQDPNRNLVEFVEEYKKELTRTFLIHFSGTSRSTSVVANVMDDAKNEVIVKFLDHDMLWLI